jgi:hypothetical protein
MHFVCIWPCEWLDDTEQGFMKTYNEDIEIAPQLLRFLVYTLRVFLMY